MIPEDETMEKAPVERVPKEKIHAMIGANDENVVVNIVETLERQCAAWNEGNIKMYMNGYAEDAIYISQSILKTQANASAHSKSLLKTRAQKENDICLHGRIAIQELFEDVLNRSIKLAYKFLYRQLQVRYATAERAFVIGRYAFSKDHEVVDEGVFTLDMACKLEAGDDGVREWKIKTEHASSVKR